MTEEGYLEYVDLVEGMRVKTMNTEINQHMFREGLVVRRECRLVFRFDDYSYADEEDSHDSCSFFKLIPLSSPKSTYRGICDFIRKIEEEYN